jgi:hypothetical protein
MVYCTGAVLRQRVLKLFRILAATLRFKIISDRWRIRPGSQLDSGSLLSLRHDVATFIRWRSEGR